MNTQTIVFQFETREQCRAVLDQFQPMMLADNLPRISALSSDDEMKRAELMFQAVERYDDHYDLREAIVALAETTDLQNWSWESTKLNLSEEPRNAATYHTRPAHN